MKLPNGDRAIVDEAKLREYCLSPSHPRGRHKARLFAASLGLTSEHVPNLLSHLLVAARDGEAVATKTNAYGQFYEITFSATGPLGSAADLSVWIILNQGDGLPRLVTCYPV